MSLNVSPALLEKAEADTVTREEFISCIRQSLPFAWSMVERLVTQMRSEGTESAQNTEVPETGEQWGQMFRMFSSDSMRNAIEAHFGVRLAFQNCCKPAVFDPAAKDAFQRFISPAAQLLNQNPILLNC
jgi:hypothetical protein